MVPIAFEHMKLLIVGIDGATLDLIKPWTEADHLPNLKKTDRYWNAWAIALHLATCYKSSVADVYDGMQSRQTRRFRLYCTYWQYVFPRQCNTHQAANDVAYAV